MPELSFIRTRTLRQWHRWFGACAAIFLLWASATGVVVAATEKFGAAERLREATRDLVSPMSSGKPTPMWSSEIERALRAVTDSAGDAPIDQIQIQYKGAQPTVTVFTGRPTGGEDRKFIVAAKTGAILSVEAYADKPFLYRLHSGEVFGDGGLVVAMFWGLALVVLSISGFLIYLTMRRRDAAGLQRWFY